MTKVEDHPSAVHASHRCGAKSRQSQLQTTAFVLEVSARINKTDRNDARGIAQMMRVGLFKAVHVKTPASQHRRLLLTCRKLLQRKIYDIENDLRGSLRNFVLKVGAVGSAKFEARVRELVVDHPIVAAVVEPLLEARAVLRTQFAKLHRVLLDLVRADPVCRRLMSAPGVGPIVALSEVRSALVATEDVIKNDIELQNYRQKLDELGVPINDDDTTEFDCKGIMAIGTYRETPLNERNEPSFPDAVARAMANRPRPYR